MRAVVVYESVYGVTHHIAEVVATALAEQPGLEAEVLAPDEAGPEQLGGVDLLVVGGPTHIHGMARASTKQRAAKAEEIKRAKGMPAVDIDEQAFGETLRDWFDDLADGEGWAASFDTRLDGRAAMTGRASKGIARRLRRHGRSLIVPPESFLVDTKSALIDGEEERARAWGQALAVAFANDPTRRWVSR